MLYRLACSSSQILSHIPLLSLFLWPLISLWSTRKKINGSSRENMLASCVVCVCLLLFLYNLVVPCPPSFTIDHHAMHPSFMLTHSLTLSSHVIGSIQFNSLLINALLLLEPLLLLLIGSHLTHHATTKHVPLSPPSWPVSTIYCLCVALFMSISAALPLYCLASAPFFLSWRDTTIRMLCILFFLSRCWNLLLLVVVRCCQMLFACLLCFLAKPVLLRYVRPSVVALLYMI